MTPRTPLTGAALAARAAYILRDNSSGSVTKAAPELYPHQWSWDSAFNAIGLAAVDVPRATAELDSLFSAQWSDGMVPHIVFDPSATVRYFPGPEWWDSGRSPAAPRSIQTSGICQPAVHALAAERILEVASRADTDETHAAAWLTDFYPKLLAWHRFLARDRVDPGTGLVTIYHGWESGLDNSPRWDAAYAGVQVDPDLPPYQRHDLAHVADPSERPTALEYDRYLTLVEEAKRVNYDPGGMRETGSFRVGDVLFTAIFAAANDALARLATRVGATDGDELEGYAGAARRAVLNQIDPVTGLAGDVDLRAGEALRTETVAGFAPLIAGFVAPVAGEPAIAARDRLAALLAGPRWMGHPSLRWALPPSTSPESSDFRPRSYWRGPVWPVMNWLLGRSLLSVGEATLAEAIRSAGLAQLGDAAFGEYYEPFTGEPLGSHRQSWTAAVALDWLVDGSLE